MRTWLQSEAINAIWPSKFGNTTQEREIYDVLISKSELQRAQFVKRQGKTGMNPASNENFEKIAFLRPGARRELAPLEAWKVSESENDNIAQEW